MNQIWIYSSSTPTSKSSRSVLLKRSASTWYSLVRSCVGHTTKVSGQLYSTTSWYMSTVEFSDFVNEYSLYVHVSVAQSVVRLVHMSLICSYRSPLRSFSSVPLPFPSSPFFFALLSPSFLQVLIENTLLFWRRTPGTLRGAATAGLGLLISRT